MVHHQWLLNTKIQNLRLRCKCQRELIRQKATIDFSRELEEDNEEEMDKLRNQLEAEKTQLQTAKDKEIGKSK